MDLLISPLQYEFFRRGLVVALLVGSVAGLIGTYVVLRGMSYIGHGLSHAVFGGAVIGYVVQINFYVGAGLWGLLAAFLIHALTRRPGVGADAAIGVVTTASFALGVALLSRMRSFTRNFEAALFGNILGVTAQDLWVIAVVSLVAVLVTFLLYNEFLYTIFDRESARVCGVPTEVADVILSLLLAAVVIASMQVIGVTMLAAAIVTPAVTARLLTERFDRMLMVATAIGGITAGLGIYASFIFNMASGATVVLVAAAVFGLVFGATWLAAHLRPASLTVTAAHEHSHWHGGEKHFHPHPHAREEKVHHPPGDTA